VLATGDYVTVVSLVTLAGGITDAGLATIGVRELSTLPTAAARHFFASLCGLRLVFMFAGVAAALGFAALSGYRSTLVLGTALAGGGFVLLTTQTGYSLPLLAQLRLGWVTAVELLRQLGTALMVVVLVLLGAPLLPFWATTIPAGIAATAFAAFLIRRTMPLIPIFDGEVWASLLRRTLPYSMATAVGVIYFRLAILIMSHVASGEQTGYYGASFRIIEVLFVAGARPGISLRGISRPVLAALLGALALIPAGISDIARPMLALFIYGAGLLVLRAIPAELLEQIRWERR
jgi:hypothetical protein